MGVGGDVDVVRNPAAKLLDFFEDVARKGETGWKQPRFDVSQAVMKSGILNHLEAVTPELMGLWLQQ